jgi:hypothetical protein
MFAVVMEFMAWLADYLFSKRTTYHGRHWTDTVDTVPADYHPTPELCGYPGLWAARVDRSVYYLVERVSALPRAIRIASTSNWGWMNIPTDEWPEYCGVNNG